MFLRISLPWPPSANRYWRYWRGRVLTNTEARQYKRHIKQLSYTWDVRHITGRLEMFIKAYPPDKRKRDLDNLLKITIDSLESTGLFDDDSQIDKIVIKRAKVMKDGNLNIRIYSRDV